MDFSIFNLINLKAKDGATDEDAAMNEDGGSDDGTADGGVNTITFINEDFWQLIFRFGFTLLILFIIIRLIYYPTTKRKDYLFTYLLISVITFFICYTLQSNKIKLGLALGLFAVFGIIRYRTDAIAIKEMTYLFIVIGLSVINALSNDKVSIAEILFTNFAVIVIVYGLEYVWLLKHEHSRLVIYEKIDLIKPERRQELIKDLEDRTGLKINRVSIGKTDFMRDTAQIMIFFFDEGNTMTNVGSNSNDDDD